MSASLKSHAWLAAAGLVAALVIAAACGSSSASKKPASSSAAPSTAGADSAELDGTLNTTKALPDAASAASAPPAASQRAAAPNGGAAGSGGGAPPSQLPPQLDRKIIQTATLQIEAGEVSKRFEDAGNIAAAAGGFIASSSFGNAGDRQTASVTIRVPGGAYQRVLGELRKLGDVKSEQSGANDVTEEYTDLGSRLRNLQATEARYAEFLQRAQNINEVLTVQDRLSATRGEIEQVQGRIQLLDHQTDLATITVHLDPPPLAKTDEPKKATGARSPLEVAADSFEASLAVLLGLATVVLAVAAFSWWLVPVGAAAAYIARRQLRGGSDRDAPPPVPPPA